MLPPQMHHWFQVLLLSMNQLVTLPPEIAALTALTHLDVSLNSITGLTSGQLPPRLVRLNMQVGEQMAPKHYMLVVEKVLNPNRR